MKTAPNALDAEARKHREKIRSIAWDCTVGAGNDSEQVDTSLLAEGLGREPTLEERQAFKNAWARCLQEMAQP